MAVIIIVIFMVQVLSMDTEIVTVTLEWKGLWKGL